MHALAVRKELGISLSELASELGISKYDISKFEKLRGVEPWVISVIVTRFERELRQCGIQVDKWFVARPQPKEIPPKPGQNVDAYGRLAPNLQISRKGRATVLTIDRKRQKSHEEKAGKV
jgi:transcriptional regulator with XRE-family HTH domain